MSFKDLITYKRILIRHIYTSVISWCPQFPSFFIRPLWGFGVSGVRTFSLIFNLAPVGFRGEHSSSWRPLRSLFSENWLMIAFITCKSSLVPLREGLCSSNRVDLSSRFFFEFLSQKHIPIWVCHRRKCWSNKMVELHPISTRFKIAYIGTKALTEPAFVMLRNVLLGITTFSELQGV